MELHNIAKKIVKSHKIKMDFFSKYANNERGSTWV